VKQLYRWESADWRYWLANSCCRCCTLSNVSLAWRVIWCDLPRVLSYAVNTRYRSSHILNQPARRIKYSRYKWCRSIYTLMPLVGIKSCFGMQQYYYSLWHFPRPPCNTTFTCFARLAAQKIIVARMNVQCIACAIGLTDSSEFTEAINAEDTGGMSRLPPCMVHYRLLFNKTILVSGSKYTLLIQ